LNQPLACSLTSRICDLIASPLLLPMRNFTLAWGAPDSNIH
jgi:hypothetical protein